jgi:hypothetical protein
VCDLSLLVAYAEERQEIAAEDVHSVCAELLPLAL